MIDANQELTLKLTAQECNVLFGALGELPYRVSQPLIDKLRQQIREVDPTAFDPPAANPPAMPAVVVGNGVDRQP